MANIDSMRRADGTLMDCADGGYPVYYTDREGSILDADCANAEEKTGYIPQFSVVDFGINYEDPDMACDQCGKPIRSAYQD